MTDRPKVVNMEPIPDKMVEAVENLRRNLKAITEFHRINAGIRRQAYLAHLREGFTPEQALELVKKLW